MADDEPQQGNGEQRALTGGEKRLLALLGMPTFAFALSITVVTTYLPVLVERMAGSTAIVGLIIAAEGLVAVTLPFIVGPWSDQLETPLGSRLPFLLVGVPLMTGCLALLGLLPTVWLIAIAVFVFFAAYYVGYEPYRAMYPDVLDDEIAGRGQSSQAIFRGAGTGVALVGGGLLFSISPAAPFIVFAILGFGAAAEFAWGVLNNKLERRSSSREERSVRDTVRRVRGLISDRPELRAYLVANSCWELALAALKTFIILFLTVGVGMTIVQSVAVIGVVAVFILIAGATAGKLGDRFGTSRVMTVAVAVFGLGTLLPFFTQELLIVGPTVPFTAYAGGVVLALPYALLIPLMPEDEHGLLTGFYSATRGFGIMLGPLVAGALISLLDDELTSTAGYAAMWLVIGGALLTSLPYMRWLRAAERRDAREAGRLQEATT